VRKLSFNLFVATLAAPGVIMAGADTRDNLQEVVVTAERRDLLGTTTTASEGVVVNDELALTPAYRPGQLLETVPGLQVTSHSGEGKANQYLMRGYNLDHGTDLSVAVDGMPVNSPTHAHGQGYTDLNFMIPELATNIHFTKGTYYADRGDFASVGSIRLSYLNRIEDQINLTGGNFGFRRLFAAGSVDLGSIGIGLRQGAGTGAAHGSRPALGGNLLAALELQHYDGPWDNPDDQRKMNAVLRYSQGDEQQGGSLTGMFYHKIGRASCRERV